jgi:hypothetical protein
MGPKGSLLYIQNPTLVNVWGVYKSVRIDTLYFYTFHFNIILSFTKSHTSLFLQIFELKYELRYEYIAYLSIACYKLRQSHFPSIDYPTIVW